MVMCWAYGCNHYNERDGCNFFRIPKNAKVKKSWLKLLRFVVKKPVRYA